MRKSPAREYEKSHLRRKKNYATLSTSACIQKVQRAIKKEIQETVDEFFLEACEVLEDERKAKMFVAINNVMAWRKWLLETLQ